MRKANYEVELLINGKPIKEYMHKGMVYVEGREEAKFSLRLRNNSYGRKLFIPSIDGLSVMDGENASENSGGYIVNGYSAITIDGWRLNDKEVAEFFFSSPEKSYRKRMNKGSNIGVVGCLVFDEYVWTPPYSGSSSYFGSGFGQGHSGAGGGGGTATIRCHASSMSGTANSMCCSTSAPTNALGTGFGETKNSEVISTEFQKSGSPTIIEIYYNTREQLEKLGVPMREAVYVAPQAFPGRFCKRPRD